MELELFTDRTHLRLVNTSDLSAIHGLHLIPEVDEYNTLGVPENIEETKALVGIMIARNTAVTISEYTFVIKGRSENDFIGLLGLRLGLEKYNRGELWYKLHPDYWNKGIATEVVKGIISYGFSELKLHRIEAGCAVGNIGSIRVLEKAGMTREGRARKILPLKSGWSDNYQYGIIESDLTSD